MSGVELRFLELLDEVCEMTKKEAPQSSNTAEQDTSQGMFIDDGIFATFDEDGISDGQW